MRMLTEDKVLSRGQHHGLRVAKDAFLRWAPADDEPFIYEFNDGVIESKPAMKQAEAYVIRNIEDAFSQTQAFRERSRLLTEMECWVTDKQMRRPDMALYTGDQIRQMALNVNQIPAFVIELTSQYDDYQKGLAKLREYFAAGVQAVWYVFPDERLVYAYTAPKLVVISSDTDILSAAPALTDLALTVDALFQI